MRAGGLPTVACGHRRTARAYFREIEAVVRGLAGRWAGEVVIRRVSCRGGGVLPAVTWAEAGVAGESADTGEVAARAGDCLVSPAGQAITWRHEEKESVLADVGDGFAAVLRVPGPAELGSNWRWEADARAAPQWDARVDELVSSFWAVHYDDSQITRDAVFVWAPWPVAVAVGARVTARRRGLVLHVRQLPSLADMAVHHELVTVSATVTMTIEPLGAPAASQRGRPGVRGTGEAGLLLIVRVTHGPVGPIPVDLANAGPFTVHVSPSLAGRVTPVGTQAVQAAEWRLAPRTAGTARVPDLPWQAFPAAAQAIADWVAEQAAAHPGRVVLLAARFPQELAVGVGVQLGQRSWDRAPGRQWPRQVYPVFYGGDSLVVPDLRLGAESVPSHRK